MLGKSLALLSALTLAAIPASADARNRGGDGRHHYSGKHYGKHARGWDGRGYYGDRRYRHRHGRDRFYVGYPAYYGGYYRPRYYDPYYAAPYYGGYYGAPVYGGYYGAPVFSIRIGDGGRRHHYRRRR